MNIVTKTEMADGIVNHLLKRDEIGQELYISYVADRITSDRVPFWSPMKKANLKMWKDTDKVVKYKTKVQVVSIKGRQNTVP